MNKSTDVASAIMWWIRTIKRYSSLTHRTSEQATKGGQSRENPFKDSVRSKSRAAFALREGDRSKLKLVGPVSTGKSTSTRAATIKCGTPSLLRKPARNV